MSTDDVNVGYFDGQPSDADAFEARVNDLVDRRIAPDSDPELQELAAGSEEYRAILNSYTLLLDRVAKLAPPEPSADFRDRLLEAVHQTAGEPKILPMPSARWWFFGAAAAATLALAIPLVSSYTSRSGVAGKNPIAKSGRVTSGQPIGQSGVKQSTAASKPTDQLPGGQESQDPKNLVRYAEFAQQTSAVLSDLVLLVSEISANPQKFAQEAKSRTSDSQTVVEQLSEGLEPLANSAAGAFDFLLEVLPSVDQPRS